MPLMTSVWHRRRSQIADAVIIRQAPAFDVANVYNVIVTGALNAHDGKDSMKRHLCRF